MPANEVQRLQVLHAYGLSGSASDGDFSEVTALASYIFQVPIAVVAVIDEQEGWVKAHVGLEVTVFPRDHSFCGHVIVQPEGMVVPDALADPRFTENPLVKGLPGIRFVAGTPLVTYDGYALGALCIGDTEPHPDFAPEQHKTLQMLGRQLMTQIDLRYSSAYLAQVLVKRQREEAQQRLRLQEQQRRLDLINEQKDHFIALLAHELRNPLAPILNAIEILRSPDPGDAAEIIDRQVRHLSRLVEDLLDLSRAAKGKIVLKKAILDLTQATRAAARAAAPSLAKRRQHFLIDLPEEPLWIEADGDRVEQIVCNLLANAVKFTPEEKSIRLTLRGEGNEAVLQVQDEGIGIPDEMQERIFEPFVQVGGGLREPCGLGLGLPLVRKLTQLHNGTVEVRSEGPERGSEFTVRLPLSEPSQAEPHPAPPARAPAAAHRRILVIEDNSDLGTTLERLLRLWKYEALLIPSGEQAVEEARKFRPDVALIDISLPHMNGYEVARAFQAVPELRSVRLIAISGYGEDSDRLRAAQAGFNDFFIKPLVPAQLRETLAESQGVTSV